MPACTDLQHGCYRPGIQPLPDIIIGRLNLWDAASATDSLLFTFAGTVITLPMIIGYTILSTGFFTARQQT